jgi:hypothetical protein
VGALGGVEDEVGAQRLEPGRDRRHAAGTDVDGGDLVTEGTQGGADVVDGLLPIEHGLRLVIVIVLKIVGEGDAHRT